MTDNEIIRALECCANGRCLSCPLNPKIESVSQCAKMFLDLINRLEAENERLRKEAEWFSDIGKLYSEIKAEAYKECIEKVKDLRRNYTGYALDKKLDNLSKELVGTDFTQMFMGVNKLEPIPNNEKELVGDDK